MVPVSSVYVAISVQPYGTRWHLAHIVMSPRKCLWLYKASVSLWRPPSGGVSPGCESQAVCPGIRVRYAGYTGFGYAPQAVSPSRTSFARTWIRNRLVFIMLRKFQVSINDNPQVDGLVRRPSSLLEGEDPPTAETPSRRRKARLGWAQSLLGLQLREHPPLYFIPLSPTLILRCIMLISPSEMFYTPSFLQ